MRLVRRLFKLLVVVAVAAAVLGGAAALGSTLFEAPPKDAAEFADWVAEGSKHADPSDGKGKAADRQRTPAERRFIRRLNEMCSRQERELDQLPTPQSSQETLDFLSRLL